MRNRYYKKVKNEKNKRLEEMNRAIEYNKNQIKKMSNDLKLELSIESFKAVNDRKVDLWRKTRKIIEERDILKEEINEILSQL